TYSPDSCGHAICSPGNCSASGSVHLKNITSGFGCILAVTLAATLADAQTAPKYSAKIPPYITTPDQVETSIGTLKFFDGLPDAETVQKVYDNLDRARGV